MISVGDCLSSREKVASFIKLLLCAKHSVGSLSFPPTLGGSHHLHFTEQPQLGESTGLHLGSDLGEESGMSSGLGAAAGKKEGGCLLSSEPMRALGETGQLLGRAQAVAL